MDAERISLRARRHGMRATGARDANAGWGAEQSSGKGTPNSASAQNKRVIASKEADQTAVQQTAVQGALLTIMHTDHLNWSLSA
ncbi:hypothetical protein XPU_4077, partial [Xanthomonas arboricola pv. pruni str. MAFF 311562]